jgi:hypothetical protein
VWVTDRLYSISGVRIQIRSTTPRLAERAHTLVAPFLLPGDDPATSDLCYSLIGGKPPVRKGQRSYAFLYRETQRVMRTLDESALLAGLLEQIVTMVPRLFTGTYAIDAGMVIRDGAGVVLAGAQPAETRRLVAAFCARGYTYASSTLLCAGGADRVWAPCPLPLVAGDAEEARAYGEAGLAPSAEALTRDPEQTFPLAVCFPPGDVMEVTSPPPGVRAVVVVTQTPQEEEPAIAPLGKARAALRLLTHSAAYTVQGPQDERVTLLRDLLAGATVFELRVPASPNGLAGSAALALSAVEHALG